MARESRSPSDLDARLRQALSEDVAAAPFDDAEGSARGSVVAGVRRRHQRRIAVAGGVTAALVAVAIVAAVGVSRGGGPHVEEGQRAAATPATTTTMPKSASLPSPHAATKAPPASPSSPSFGVSGAGSGAGAAANAPASAAPPATSSASGASRCVVVQVGSGSPSCAGTSGPSGHPDEGSYAAAATPVHATVGQLVRVTRSGSTTPRVTSGTSVLVPVTTGASGSGRTVFRAVRPGTATITARTRCPASTSGCERTVWTLTVEVTR